MKPLPTRTVLCAAIFAAFIALFSLLPDGIYQLALFVGAIVAFCFTFNHFLRRP